MAKISSIKKNEHRQKLVRKFSSRRTRLKKIISSKSIPASERFQAVIKLSEMPRNGAKVRIMNRCNLTGRPHAVYRKFGLSRIALRDLASNGQIPGLVKASW